MRPSACSRWTSPLPSASGSTSAIDLVDARAARPPLRRCAGCRRSASPRRRPRACSCSIASAVVALIGSATPRQPASRVRRRRRTSPSRLAPAARPPVPHERRRSTPSSCQQGAVADATLAARRPGRSTPLPVTESKSSAAGRSTPRSSAPSTIASASGCSLRRSRPRRQPQQRRSRPASAGSTDRLQLRPSLGQGAGLVHDQRVDLAQRLDRLGGLEQHAGLTRRDRCATMIDIGVARPRAHGQAMISTATALTSA